MAKHDWRGGSEKQFCGNVGCAWVRLMGGIPGDKRIRYQNGKDATPVLKPHSCRGVKADEECCLRNGQPCGFSPSVLNGPEAPCSVCAPYLDELRAIARQLMPGMADPK